MKLIAVMTMGLLALAGCQTETVEQKAERYMMEPFVKAQASPRIIARTYAPRKAVEEQLNAQYPIGKIRTLGPDRCFYFSRGAGGPWGFSEQIYVLIREWGHGSELRYGSDDDSPGFEHNMATIEWTQLRDRVDDIPAQSWLVYPPDPAGQYASKKFGAPKPGSPELSLN